MPKHLLKPTGVRSSPSQLLKPATTAGFSFIANFGDKTGTMAKNYKNITLHTTGKKWFVQYYFRVPDKLRGAYKNAVWKRFKVYEEINRVKTLEYARTLLKAVEFGLNEGFDPFADEQKEAVASRPKKEWTIIQGLNYFRQKWAERGNEPETLERYIRAISRLTDWLHEKGMQNMKASELTSDHLEAHALQYKKKLNWSNRTYNNHVEYLATVFNFLGAKSLVNGKPISGVHKQKTLARKHRAYDKNTFPVVLKEMKKDPALYLASQIVYYLCIRSDKELKNLKVKHIDPERMQVWVMAETAKTGQDRPVPMCDEMLNAFKEAGILNANPDHYVISSAGRPGPAQFGKGFLTKRMVKVRRVLGLDSAYSLYALKHTRIIHLKRDGAQDAEIMALTGHKTYLAFSVYLRDLGMDLDPAAINKYTRKI